MLKNLIFKYLIYIVYFLGIGMVSSGIVLMPFNAGRYGLILLIGLILFTTGSFINEILLEKKQMSSIERIKLIVVSLTLAIGIGMISGGIAHFKESPLYVSFLIPLGLVISFASFKVKHNIQLSKKENLMLIIGLFIVSSSIYTGLSLTAASLDASNNGGDIFKGHNM